MVDVLAHSPDDPIPSLPTGCRPSLSVTELDWELSFAEVMRSLPLRNYECQATGITSCQEIAAQLVTDARPGRNILGCLSFFWNPTTPTAEDIAAYQAQQNRMMFAGLRDRLTSLTVQLLPAKDASEIVALAEELIQQIEPYTEPEHPTACCLLYGDALLLHSRALQRQGDEFGAVASLERAALGYQTLLDRCETETEVDHTEIEMLARGILLPTLKAEQAVVMSRVFNRTEQAASMAAEALNSFYVDVSPDGPAPGSLKIMRAEAARLVPGRYALARKLLTSVVDDPDNPQSFTAGIILCDLYVKNDGHVQAQRIGQQLLDGLTPATHNLSVKTHAVLDLLIRSSLVLDDYEEAEGYLRRAIGLEGEVNDSLVSRIAKRTSLGDCRLERKDIGDAIKWYERAIALAAEMPAESPQRQSLRSYLAKLYERQGNFPKMADTLYQVLNESHQPDALELQVSYAHALLQLGQSDRATEIARHVSEQAGATGKVLQDATIIHARGIVHTDEPLAIQLMDGIRPTRAELRDAQAAKIELNYGALLYEAGNIADAIDVLLPLAQVAGEGEHQTLHVNAQIFLIAAYLELEQYDTALEHSAHALEWVRLLLPEHQFLAAEVFFISAQVQMEHNDPELARDLLAESKEALKECDLTDTIHMERRLNLEHQIEMQG